MDLHLSAPQAADPMPGPQHAVPATPPRAPGSVRRTTSLDIARPDGLLGRVVADVRGQDVVTGPDGAGRVVDRLGVTIEVEPRAGTVTAVHGSAGGRRLAGLVGERTRGGFGRRLADLLAGEAERRTLLYSALDDLSGALLVSGYPVLHAGLIPRSVEQAEERARFQADVCIGWASGGPLLEGLRRNGTTAVPAGPGAPVLDGDDPLAWHATAPLATHTVRRRRRLDVTGPPPAGSPLLVGSHFRDSCALPDGEMVMHEYLVDADVDGAGRIGRLSVQPRVLPWRECPGAVTSAQQLVGASVAEIPPRARAELVGPGTCTHLTSTLRCLADVEALAGQLGSGGAGQGI